MNDNRAFIDSLGEKIRRVIDDNRRLREEMARLAEERDGLVLRNRETEERARSLERRVKTLETAGAFAGNRADYRAARLRVNRLLREIDSCIALMNK